MTLYELFDNCRNELTDDAIRFIEDSDQIAIKDLGNDWNPDSFNQFIAELED